MAACPCLCACVHTYVCSCMRMPWRGRAGDNKSFGRMQQPLLPCLLSSCRDARVAGQCLALSDLGAEVKERLLLGKMLIPSAVASSAAQSACSSGIWFPLFPIGQPFSCYSTFFSSSLCSILHLNHLGFGMCLCGRSQGQNLKQWYGASQVTGSGTALFSHLLSRSQDNRIKKK